MSKHIFFFLPPRPLLYDWTNSISDEYYEIAAPKALSVFLKSSLLHLESFIRQNVRRKLLRTTSQSTSIDSWCIMGALRECSTFSDLVGLAKIYCYDTQEKNMLGMAVSVVERDNARGELMRFWETVESFEHPKIPGSSLPLVAYQVCRM